MAAYERTLDALPPKERSYAAHSLVIGDMSPTVKALIDNALETPSREVGFNTFQELILTAYAAAAGYYKEAYPARYQYANKAHKEARGGIGDAYASIVAGGGSGSITSIAAMRSLPYYYAQRYGGTFDAFPKKEVQSRLFDTGFRLVLLLASQQMTVFDGSEEFTVTTPTGAMIDPRLVDFAPNGTVTASPELEHRLKSIVMTAGGTPWLGCPILFDARAREGMKGIYYTFAGKIKKNPGNFYMPKTLEPIPPKD